MLFSLPRQPEAKLRSMTFVSAFSMLAACSGLLGLSCAFLAEPSSLAAQTLATAQVPVATTAAPAPAATRAKTVRSPARGTKPLWNELSRAQHEALAPLASHWDLLNETQKRKWLLVSRNYHSLPLSDQTRLHGRMDEWVALSPQQRQTARFNFAETKRLSSDEKQKKWQAYQALSPDDRRKFVEVAKPAAPQGAAVAVKPVPRQRLAPIAAGPGRAPRIAGVNQIDSRTLLPQRGAASTLAPKQDGR